MQSGPDHCTLAFAPEDYQRYTSVHSVWEIRGLLIQAFIGSLRRSGSDETLYRSGEKLQTFIKEQLEKSTTEFQIVGEATLFEVLFTNKAVVDYRSTLSADKSKSQLYSTTLREHGVFKSLGKTYPSLALTDDDFQHTENALIHAAQALRQEP